MGRGRSGSGGRGGLDFGDTVLTPQEARNPVIAKKLWGKIVEVPPEEASEQFRGSRFNYNAFIDAPKNFNGDNYVRVETWHKKMTTPFVNYYRLRDGAWFSDLGTAPLRRPPNLINYLAGRE